MIDNVFIIQLVFAISAVYQIVYWLYFYYPLIKHLKKNNKDTFLPDEQLPAVSVIVSAKNESVNLKKYLPSLLNQNYPLFEVIVIDDYSTDSTLAVLETFATTYRHLKIINKHKFDDVVGKKYALEAGIRQSKYDILLFTDADCEPTSSHWIKCMASKFDETTEIVLGYGPYQPEQTFLNRFIRFETYQTIFSYAGFALKGLTYMGVGRNLAYKKALFEKIDGFNSHKHIASGDDDLFIAQAATRNNVKLCLNSKAWCYSSAKKNWKAYVAQKQRHVGTSNEYKLFIKILLALNTIFHIVIYLIFLFYFFEPLPFIIVLMIVRLIVLCIVYNNLFKQLNECDVWLKSMLFDFIFIAYYFLSFKGLFNKSKSKW